MAIDLAVTDGVTLITINRPEVHNAMDAEHCTLLSDAWLEVRDDTNTRVAIITGAGLLQTSRDVQEGVNAFAEKRTPAFEGE